MRVSAGAPAPLPRARLRPPLLRALQRDRLLTAMRPSLGHRLTLVTGPAGSGKTTLLAQFVAHHPGPTAWYRAEVDDVAPAVLLDHLADALAVAVPGLARDWRSIDDAVAALDLSRPPGPDGAGVVLAIDDLHVVVGSDAEEVLRRLVDAVPAWLHLAATCRASPNWNLSRLRVSGALLEIGADDLRFRSWEVERLFGDVYGKPLPPGDLAHLTRGLEGWAAGLQLFHLATRDKPVGERRRAVAALPARSMLVREYLSGNVLDGLPPDQTAFLLDTSVIGRLTPALCDELRGRDDSRRMLDELESRQVFVSRLEDDDSYRYHEVFRSYLEGRLVERDGEARARERAARAAALLEADGSLVDALRAYCRAADWASVGRVLEKGGAELAGDPGDWLDALPRSLVDDDAWVMLATARRAVATGRFATALGIYDRTLRCSTSAACEEVTRRERAALAAWLDPSATPPATWTGRARQVLRGIGTPGPPGPPAPPGGRSVPGAVGEQLADALLALLRGQVAKAAHALTAVADDPHVSEVLAGTARLGLAVAHALAPGSVPEPDSNELLELVEMADVPWLSWMARASGSLGAPDPWRQALAVARTLERQGDAWGSALARLFGALGAATGGATSPADVDQMRDLCADLRRLDAPVLEVWARAWRATALARAGLTVDAREAAAEAVITAARHGLPGARVWALATDRQLAEPEAVGAVDAAIVTIRRQSRVDVTVPAIAGGSPPAPVRGPQPPSAAPVGGATDARPAARDATPGDGHRTTAGPAHEAATGSGAAAPVSVRTLAGFSLDIAGRPVDLGEVRPRARSVLRYLAAQAGRPVHAETLAAALWPDVDGVAAKRNLQVALSSLRKALDGYPAPGAGLIRRDGPTYALALPEGSEHDLATVAAAVEQARAMARAGDPAGAVAAGQRALAAYAGDLLPEEGPADWVCEGRRALDTGVAETAALVAEQALESGQPDAAVAACLQGLGVDRYHDGLWRLLIRAQVASGDVAAATRTQDRYRDVLSELGLQTS